jgi:hypothetical protein
MKTITVAEILALTPCKTYNEEIITPLFQGKFEVTSTDILAFPIHDLDKLWLLEKAGFISQEDLVSIKQLTVDNFVKDSSTPEYQDYLRVGTTFAYGPLCRYLARTNNTSISDAVEAVTSFVLSQVKGKVQ